MRNRVTKNSGTTVAASIGLLAAWILVGSQAAIGQTIPRAAAPSPTVNAATAQSVTFIPLQDPWAPSKQRWYDISNDSEKRFDAFLDGTQEFNYNSVYTGTEQITQVTLTFDTAPSVPYFVGHIEARGLKPNFAYQLKLVGKPVKGTRGWGAYGDDLANERLGYAGRWWCDSYHSTTTNFDDSHYVNYYKNAPENGNPVHDIYGYLYAGVFVTNSKGDASMDFTGKNSYHITWAEWQSGTKNVEESLSPFQVAGNMLSSAPTIYYGYGSAAPLTSTRLYYEYEGNGRPKDNVILAPGTYKARFVLTEESFHNSSGNAEGGYWKTVLGSEEYARDGIGTLSPDTSESNDISFTIAARPPAAPTNLTARALSKSQIALGWTDNAGNEVGFYIERKTSLNGAWSRIATVGADVISFSNTSLASNTTYYYRVQAHSAVGTSSYSNTAIAKTLRR